MSKGHRDAIVIGAGPGGSAAAIALTRAGWSVTLADRGPHRRAKCCGHCVHPRAFAALERLGCADRIRLVCAGDTRRGEAWVVDADGARRIADEPFATCGAVIDRATLDAALVDAARDAGVTVRHGAAARLAPDRTAVELDGARHEAELIVGADGLGSGVARAAGLAAGGAGRKFGFALDVVPTPDHAWRHERIVMLVARGGYLGVVGTGDGLHLAACLQSTGRLPTRPIDAIQWFAERTPALRDALGAAWQRRVDGVVAAGPMPWRTIARTTSRVALVGDAAGYVEPFTGEGIAWAIESGAALGEAIGAGGAWDAAARLRYERAWNELARASHRRCRVVAGIVERPRLVATLGATLGAIGRVAPRVRRNVVRGLVSR
ncbi:MAG: NAD(P)/FAD-dependent oxidoreductase [Phycisphaerales bacterium]